MTSWEDRYRQIIQMGKDLPPMSSEYKIDRYRVQGCQSQVWLYSCLSPEGKLSLQADSDALIVKGLLALLLQIYSDTPIEEVLTSPSVSFWKKLQLQEHLTPTRSNGFHALLKQIHYDAQVIHLTQNQK